MKNKERALAAQTIQVPQEAGRELILSAAYEELLYYHLMSIRRLKYAIVYLFGFWTCALLVELRLWLDCP